MNKKVSLICLYVKKIIGDFFANTFYYGVAYAFYSLLWWIGFFFVTPCTRRITKFAIKKKTIWLDNYIEHNYRQILDKYKAVKDTSTHKVVEQHYIWVYWGQGEDAMPPLVRACYRQLIHYNLNVQLVTNSNVETFVTLPSMILAKVQKGKIGWANYSDIIRNSLLAKYGGLWLDATVWVSREIPFGLLKQMPLFSANASQEKYSRSTCFWSSFEWNWSSWCLWARESNNTFFCFVSEMLQAIAVKEKIWPDYVIQDYLFYYACRHIPVVRREMAQMSYRTPNKDSLALMMNDAFDIDKYSDLVKEEFVFKLRYRTPWKKCTPHGECTFYGRILVGII